MFFPHLFNVFGKCGAGDNGHDAQYCHDHQVDRLEDEVDEEQGVLPHQAAGQENQTE